MATKKEYLDYVLDQLSELQDIRARTMMGEYVLYYRDRVIGGIYDDRFLVKPTKSAKALLPDAPEEPPYEGAKPMILVDRMEDRAFLRELVEAMYGELPERKGKGGH